ncbi:15503_t:CDS:2, partial [Entrophospora sp. SA101]
DYEGEENVEDDEEFFSEDDGYDPEAPEMLPYPRKDSITTSSEEERRSLVKVEKEAVLKKMKEQQKHSCSCSVCEELETLYESYYEELKSYANQQQFGPSAIEYRNEGGILTVADDFLKNGGKKFLEMMEQQRMEEGRRMFQIFAARMFEQRVLNAYREK